MRTEVTGDALAEILKEFADIRDRKVPADELEGAKRALVASFALNTESPGSAMSNATQIKEYGFPADYWDTYPEKIAAVTADDVQRVAKEVYPTRQHPERFSSSSGMAPRFAQNSPSSAPSRNGTPTGRSRPNLYS